MKNKLTVAMSLALVLALIAATFVLADDVANNADTSVDATYETVPLLMGGPSRQIDLYTVNRNGDGKNGCNLTGSTTLVINVTSTNPGVATVNPSRIEFTSCEAVNTNSSTAVIVTPISVGSTNIEFSLVSNNSGGSFSLDTARFTVEVTLPPNTPPTVSVTGVMGGANYEYGFVPAAGCSVTDAEDGPLSVSPVVGVVTGPLSSYGLGSQEVTCSYTDKGGLTNTASATYSINDTHGPILTVPPDFSVEATSASGAVATYSVTVSDAVDPAPDVSCTLAAGSTFPLGISTVNCSAHDVVGNTGSASFKITVQDKTAPSIDVPTDITEEATGSSGAVVSFAASANDIVDGTVAPTCTPASGSTFPLGTTKVTCSAIDKAGNPGNASFNVNVLDTTAPGVNVPASITVEATGPSGASVPYSVTVVDAVDPSPVVSCMPASGWTFPLGTTKVNCSAQDASNNTKTASFSVHVADTTAPIITFVSRTSANGNGWNNDAVEVTWSCADLVGVMDASVRQTVSTEGENQSATGTCEDTSGNKASDTQTGINIDKTKPTASASRTPDANILGWNNADVTVKFNGTDALSGIDFCSEDQIFGEGENKSASGTCTDKAGNVSATATVSNINVDKTAPTISGAPDRAANGNDWYNADVIISFTCGDALSGVDTCTAPVTLDEGEYQSASGLVTDKAGNSAQTTVTGINIDKTAPFISAALDKSPALSDWFNISTGAPTVSFTCSDALSGLDGSCPASHLFGDGKNQSYSQTVSDLAGNTASAGVSNVDVDTTAPSISVALDRSPASTGWFNEVTGVPLAKFTCSDATSGVVACPADYSFSDSENQSHSGTASDHAGNSNTASVSDVDVDITDPSLTWNGGPANGLSFYFGSVPAAPTCTAADTLSGSHGCGVTGYGTTVGSHTLTAKAFDKAGNEYSEQRSYAVLAWTHKGFYQPVDMPTLTTLVYNTVKNGSTVPLKFEIFAGPTELSDIAQVKSITYAQASCDANAVSDDIETLATGSTTLRYDATAGQFIYNWKTPNTASKCYRVTMTTLDGSSLMAYFKLK